MHTRSLAAGLGLGLGLALFLGTAFARQEAPPGVDAAEMQRMMEMAQELGAPGEQHDFLQRLVGEWDGQLSVMGMPPTPARQTVSSMFEGRFIRTEYEGSMMGQPTKGFGLTGFDNYKKKFTNVWIDSTGTVMLHAEGMLDQTGDTLSMWGPMDEWMTGEHDKPVRYVYRFLDDDTYEFEIHDLSIVPGDTKVISATFTRQD